MVWFPLEFMRRTNAKSPNNVIFDLTFLALRCWVSFYLVRDEKSAIVPSKKIKPRTQAGKIADW